MFQIFELVDDAGFTVAVNILMQSVSLYFDKNKDGKIYIAVVLSKCSRKNPIIWLHSFLTTTLGGDE